VADSLVAVGERARWIADEAKRAGLGQVVLLKDTSEAVRHLRAEIGQGDVVLVKGSRGMHMDQIIANLEERS
jgi:UDP-N-acetylmuramoyl-tripeptide--D-alanyl-D-alanine ligase